MLKSQNVSALFGGLDESVVGDKTYYKVILTSTDNAKVENFTFSVSEKLYNTLFTAKIKLFTKLEVTLEPSKPYQNTYRFSVVNFKVSDNK